MDKLTPETLVSRALDGLEAGVAEILADEVVVALKASLGLDPLERYAESLHTQ
ncbi:hypothetical protein [Nonomuraea wenchangensis]|uniref:hypothetical protein n=1 Tax=Nonomuraea wenchangensis TaxID=568860 RepID=UPI0037B3CC0C